MEATRRLGALLVIAKGFIEIVNLRLGGGTWVKSGNRWLERLWSGMWKVDTSKVVTSACVG
jgi:hypothetical protein